MKKMGRGEEANDNTRPSTSTIVMGLGGMLQSTNTLEWRTAVEKQLKYMLKEKCGVAQ